MQPLPARVLAAVALGWMCATALPPGEATASASTTITIALTAAGPRPASVTAAVGDTITFINRDATFVHGAQAAGATWSFDTGPLVPGGSAGTPQLVAPGAYDYGGSGLDRFRGQVLVGPVLASAAPAERSVQPAAPVSTPLPAGALGVQHSARRYGLPVALAAVAVVGVASLLLRVLLAHPAGATPDSVGPRC